MSTENLTVIIALGLAAVAIYIAVQAHKNHATFAAQAQADLATVKADLTSDLHKVELQVAAIKPAAPAPAPAPTVTTVTNPPTIVA